MKKSLVLMCIGGMLALCTPLTAGEAVIDPPIVKNANVIKNHEPSLKSETTETDVIKSEVAKSTAADPERADVGGYVVISAGALLLILILLILLL